MAEFPQPIEIPVGWLAALGAVLLWGWRAVSVGRQIGELTQEVKRLRADFTHLRERLEAHLDRGP